jgi:glycosyltransferase involved in cell wall biosynthesis
MWERAMDEEKNLVKKLVIALEAKRVKNYERKICMKADSILCVAESDRKYLEQIGIPKERLNVLTSVGDDSLLKLDELKYDTNEKSLLHIGTMSWEANINGILWFTNEIWPYLKKKEPELKFYIVGKNPPECIIRLSKIYKDIIVTGFVEDIEPYYQKCRVFVVPLRFGSGIKVKILNAMARGLPVVTTPVGIEGMNVQDSIDIMVGSTPDEIISKIIILLNDKTIWTKISNNARKTIQKNYTWDKVLARLDNILTS